MRAFVLLLLLLAGCDAARSALDERQAQLDAREAVMRYSEAVAPALALHGEWILAVRGLRGLGTPDAIARHVTTQVEPAHAAYLAAVAPIAAATPLDGPHRALRQAHVDVGAAFRAFADGLTRENYATRRAALGAALTAFDAAQLAYDAAVRTHYEGVGLTYAPPPALATP